MNRKIGLALVIVTVSLLAVYYTVETQTKPTPDVELKDPDIVPRTSPGSQILDIPSGNNRFAINFYKQVSDNDKNIFFSPVSMYVAFSALYEGAQGDTAKQIRQMFGLDPDPDARHKAIAQFLSHINQKDPYYTLKMANALWLADWFDVYDSYVSSVQNYKAHVEVLDLPKVGEKRINDWTTENTNNAINDIVDPADLTKDTVAVMTNAIYFAGEWTNQFPLERTGTGNFWKTGAESIEIDFMRQRGDFYYASLSDVQLLKMPYKGDRLSMLVVLPDDRNGIKSLEESLSIEMMEQWKEKIQLTDIKITIPKFTMETMYDLKTPLKKLGLSDIFDYDVADLSGIGNANGQNIFVSKSSQKTFIDVHEIGTEAAAVTTNWMRVITAPPSFIADHPFIFIIQDDKTGAVLFIGRLSDPAT